MEADVLARREYGDGSIYQRCDAKHGCPPRENGTRPAHTCRGLWVATIEAGWTAAGTRRRVTVSAKTRREALTRQKRKRTALDRGESVDSNDRVTVKQWAEKYLELRKLPPKPLSPNGWNAAASPIRKWIVPTIGHKRISTLTPGDIRSVAKAQYDAGRKTATADATQRSLITMLNWAVREGHTVPQGVLAVEKPGMGNSDRTDVPLVDAVKCLEVASTLPHWSRWALTLLYGVRQGEALGLAADAIDFEQMQIHLEWQLTTLKYKKRGDVRAGFDIPRDYEARHLTGAYHLVRPKSRAGHRVLPLVPAMAEALRSWMAEAPPNPWGLLYPTLRGTPSNDKSDREEWWAIQCTAGVGHPTSPRWFHVHECRNLAATQLDEVGASDNVVTSLLGHASITTSRGYQTAHLDAKRAAVVLVAERLGLN